MCTGHSLCKIFDLSRYLKKSLKQGHVFAIIVMTTINKHYNESIAFQRSFYILPYILSVNFTYCIHLCTQSQITSSFKSVVWKISTAESKILLVLCYYALFGIVALSHFSIGAAKQEEVATAMTDYFLCEAVGFGVECDHSGFDHFGYQGLAVVVYFLLGLIQFVSLIFVINWMVAKASVKDIWKRYSQIFSPQTTSASVKQTSTMTETGVWLNPCMLSSFRAHKGFHYFHLQGFVLMNSF